MEQFVFKSYAICLAAQEDFGHSLESRQCQCKFAQYLKDLRLEVALLLICIFYLLILPNSHNVFLCCIAVVQVISCHSSILCLKLSYLFLVKPSTVFRSWCKAIFLKLLTRCRVDFMSSPVLLEEGSQQVIFWDFTQNKYSVSKANGKAERCAWLILNVMNELSTVRIRAGKGYVYRQDGGEVFVPFPASASKIIGLGLFPPPAKCPWLCQILAINWRLLFFVHDSVLLSFWEERS